ncbi:hypothetical protein FACS189421_03240 [Bacteroidia bacterium]|nr:hypothetical protein FACS189421_03240 [Bacteroidia bacterium]
MNKQGNRLEETGNKNPFKVPEGYFEGLTGQIMSQLPERIHKEPKKVSLWERVQPWVYMAAMFAGIALMVNLFVGQPKQSSTGLNLTSEAEMEEFYQYYEEQSSNDMYREAVFVAME